MNLDILIPIGFLLLFGGVMIAKSYFSRKAVVRRKLKKAVDVKISDFLTGDIAKIVGHVEIAGDALIAPLSGRKCAYYHVLVEQLVSSGKSSYWKKLIEEEVSGTFVIRDGRYRAHIDRGSNLKTYLIQDKEYSSGLGNNATERLENYLQANGTESENWLGFNKKLRYKEGVLEQGECMAVVGRGEWRFAREMSLRESFGKILVISSTDKEPVYLSDDPDVIETAYNAYNDLPEVYDTTNKY